MLVAAHNIADVALRPVTLFANHLGRTRVFLAHMSWAVVIVEDGVIELPHAAQLRFDIGGRAGTDMALDAGDFRVDTSLGSDEFRFHGDVAGLSAEFHRLGVVIGLVTAERSHEQERDRACCEKGEEPAIAWPRKIDLNLKLPVEVERPAFSSPLQKGADNRDETSEEKEAWCNEVGQDAYVGIGMRGGEIDREQEEEREERAPGEQEPCPASPIAEIPGEGTTRFFNVRHSCRLSGRLLLQATHVRDKGLRVCIG